MSNIKSYLTIKNIIFLLLIIFFIKFICSVKALAMLIFASFVIAASLNPLVNKLEKRMKRPLATTVALLIFFTVIIGAFIPLVIILIDQVDQLVASFPEKIATIQNFIATKTIFGTKLSTIFSPEQLPNAPTEFIGNAVQKTLAASASIVGAIAIMFIIAMIVFYMLNDKEEMKNWLLSLFPSEIRKKADDVFVAISTRVGGFVIAQCSSMVSVGIVTAFGLLILGIPYAMGLGLIAGILDIVPIVGPIIATVLTISVAYTKGWLFVIGAILVIVIAQWISNNFLRPLIFGKFMDLHPLVILLSFLVAAEFLDVWGVILAPAIASVLAVIFDEVYVKQINNQNQIEIMGENS